MIMSNKRIRKKRQKEFSKALNRVKANAWRVAQAMILLSNASRRLSNRKFSDGAEINKGERIKNPKCYGKKMGYRSGG